MATIAFIAVIAFMATLGKSNLSAAVEPPRDNEFITVTTVN